MTAWELTRHARQVGLVQLPAHAALPRWAYDDDSESPLWSVSRTAEELSIICGWDAVPGTVTGVGPYVAFSVDGPLDHSLIGVLAGLLGPLAAAEIPVLAQSTYDTDWILVPAVQAARAAEVWTGAGHAVEVEEEAE